ncbi:MAG: hypothetical protein WC716_16830 [Chitinophagaceae bacterium]|jgi:hypothetical protein
MIHQPYAGDSASAAIPYTGNGDDLPISPMQPFVPIVPQAPIADGELPPPAKPPADYKPGDVYNPDGTKAARGNVAGIMAFAAIAALILWSE